MPVRLTVNGVARTVDAPPDVPLLWVLRDELGLTGTKFGCGIGACGACTVHIAGQPVRSCTMPVAAAEGRAITTIEVTGDRRIESLRRAWLEGDVAQCGYCQPGQIMTAAALLEETATPTDAQIDAAMAGNLCRCGTYQRIRRAIRAAAGHL